MRISLTCLPALTIFVLFTGCPQSHAPLTDQSAFKSPQAKHQIMPPQADHPLKMQQKSRELMFERRYEEAIAILPLVEQDMAKYSDFDKDQYLAFFHGVVVYLYLVTGKPELALEKSNEIYLNNLNVSPRYIFWYDRIALFSKLGKPDAMIDETNELLKSEIIDASIRFDALRMLFIAYAVKGDILRAKECYLEARRFFYQVDWNLDEKGRSRFEYYVKVLDLIEYYLDHLTETHIAQFDKTPPDPPIKDVTDPEGKRIYFECSCEIEFVSKADGSAFTYGDIPPEALPKIKPVHDPWANPATSGDTDKIQW